ncbi:MAG: hypothetical protein ABJF07_16105, partial [Nisaea sp.]|uniref:hypothetical protein n=1 Tax=Nisaea sp. TaxID=2024842 RepID=UPI0032658987
NQGFVVAFSKGDRRNLVDADLLGVKRTQNCVEDLTSGSEGDGLSDSDSNEDGDHPYKTMTKMTLALFPPQSLPTD